MSKSQTPLGIIFYDSQLAITDKIRTPLMKQYANQISISAQSIILTKLYDPLNQFMDVRIRREIYTQIDKTE